MIFVTCVTNVTFQWKHTAIVLLIALQNNGIDDLEAMGFL